jgi:hypothetical protein
LSTHTAGVDIIETHTDLDIFLSRITTDHVFIDVVCRDLDKHACNNELSLIFFYLIKTGEAWCLPIKHNETVYVSGAFDKLKAALAASVFYMKLVSDKKSIIQLFGRDYNFIDVGIYNFLQSGNLLEERPTTNAHTFIQNNFRNLLNLNQSIPIYKHAKVFLQTAEKIKNIIVDNVDERGFAFVNNTMVNLFSKLESNGLCVNDTFTEFFGDEQERHIKNGLIFSQYNLLTSTGRPSNRFAGVNYAAIKKDDGSRSSFVSRYKDAGMLLLMDYSAFHPRLIAHLANFHMDASENPYVYLAKYYFNKTSVNEEDIAVSKGFTFKQIYGGIDGRFIHVPYFAKVQDYIDHRWKFFEDNGYVETPKYHRKIRTCHIKNPNPNKLFNYILQAFETEVAVETLGELIPFLEDKRTKPVLYTYDSVLFDFYKEDGQAVIKKIKTIMERDRFPVKVYTGDSYDKMAQINI